MRNERVMFGGYYQQPAKFPAMFRKGSDKHETNAVIKRFYELGTD